MFGTQATKKGSGAPPGSSSVTTVLPGGTVGYIPKWTPDGTSLGNSIVFAGTNGIGVGTTTSLFVNCRLQLPSIAAEASTFIITNAAQTFARLMVGLTAGEDVFFDTTNADYFFRKTTALKFTINSSGIISAGYCDAATYKVGGVAGVDGTFTTVDLKTVTVSKGIITAIV